MSERESTTESSSGEEQSQAGQSRDSRGERSGGGRHSNRRRHHQQQQNQPRRESAQTKATINMDELREVISLVSERGFAEFEFENADIRIRLLREHAPVSPAQTVAHGSATQVTQPTISQPATPVSQPTTGNAPAAAAADESSKADDKLEIIAAPIVGTFYRAPSPTSEPFVRAGESVEQDTVVCIIEAMKLMNEIQAETSGVIEKIYVENGQPVEFGQPLFGVRKS
jgi:acetyl-CoA carboxylase biotin carboxyl carrier protein